MFTCRKKGFNLKPQLFIVDLSYYIVMAETIQSKQTHGQSCVMGVMAEWLRALNSSSLLLLCQTRKDVLMLSLGVQMSEFVLVSSLSLEFLVFLEEVRHIPQLNFLVVGATDQEKFIFKTSDFY